MSLSATGCRRSLFSFFGSCGVGHGIPSPSPRTRVKPFEVAKYRIFRVRMRVTPNPANGLVTGATRLMQLKWGTQTEPIIRSDHTVDFLGANVAVAGFIPDGKWHEYFFELNRRGDWCGWVNELWFGLSGVQYAVVDIDWMRFE